MESKDSLGDRLKEYEDAFRFHLPKRMPLIVRLDGKSFHSYTSDCERPFDEKLIEALNTAFTYVAQNMQGIKLAYMQSDEATFLMHTPDFESDTWFGGNVQKIASVSASMASAYLTFISHTVFGETKVAAFDARAFVLPVHEVCNVFEWRQQDAIRNSVQSLARAHFSHKECENKNVSQLKELCLTKGIDWNALPKHQQRGRCLMRTTVAHEGGIRKRWSIDKNIPIFHENRDYVDQYLQPPTSE